MKRKHEVPLWLIVMCLEYADKVKDRHDRDKFCISFDTDYEHKK